MIEKTFDELSIEEIEQKLEKDLQEHERHVFKWTIITLIVLAFIFRSTLIFWIKFGTVLPSGYDFKPIVTQNEPIQINYSDKEKQTKIFEMKSLINKNRIIIKPQAYYKISGLTIAINHDFFFISEFFDSAALYDIGLAWGQLSDKKFFKKNIKCYNDKIELTGARVLHCSWKDRVGAKTISHSHLVPANRKVMGGLLKIRRWQVVELEGELVDMEQITAKGRVYDYRTSMSRDDGPKGDRGYGNCETIYVKKVKIGNRIYE